MRAAEAAPQSGPVWWAHSGALMTPPPLANCCVLAARWNVNGSTCDNELRRGAAQLAQPPPPPLLPPNRVYLGHNINIWTCAGRHRGGATPKHINSLPFQCFPVCVHEAGEAGTINPIIRVARRLKRFHGNYLGRGFVSIRSTALGTARHVCRANVLTVLGAAASLEIHVRRRWQRI